MTSKQYYVERGNTKATANQISLIVSTDITEHFRQTRRFVNPKIIYSSFEIRKEDFKSFEPARRHLMTARRLVELVFEIGV